MLYIHCYVARDWLPVDVTHRSFAPDWLPVDVIHCYVARDWLPVDIVLLLCSQVPSSPPPLAAPIARRLSVSASVAGEEGLISCVLPDDLLVDLLVERLMVSTNNGRLIIQRRLEPLMVYFYDLKIIFVISLRICL